MRLPINPTSSFRNGPLGPYPESRDSGFVLRTPRNDDLMRQNLRQKLLGAVAARLAKEILLQRVLDDFALVHEDDPVRNLAGKTHFVGHDHHGHAVASQI